MYYSMYNDNGWKPLKSRDMLMQFFTEDEARSYMDGWLRHNNKNCKYFLNYNECDEQTSDDTRFRNILSKNWEQ